MLSHNNNTENLSYWDNEANIQNYFTINRKNLKNYLNDLGFLSFPFKKAIDNYEQLSVVRDDTHNTIYGAFENPPECNKDLIRDFIWRSTDGYEFNEEMISPCNFNNRDFIYYNNKLSDNQINDLYLFDNINNTSDYIDIKLDKSFVYNFRTEEFTIDDINNIKKNVLKYGPVSCGLNLPGIIVYASASNRSGVDNIKQHVLCWDTDNTSWYINNEIMGGHHMHIVGFGKETEQEKEDRLNDEQYLHFFIYNIHDVRVDVNIRDIPEINGQWEYWIVKNQWAATDTGTDDILINNSDYMKIKMYPMETSNYGILDIRYIKKRVPDIDTENNNNYKELVHSPFSYKFKIGGYQFRFKNPSDTQSSEISTDVILQDTVVNYIISNIESLRLLDIRSSITFYTIYNIYDLQLINSPIIPKNNRFTIKAQHVPHDDITCRITYNGDSLFRSELIYLNDDRSIDYINNNFTMEQPNIMEDNSYGNTPPPNIHYHELSTLQQMNMNEILWRASNINDRKGIIRALYNIPEDAISDDLFYFENVSYLRDRDNYINPKELSEFENSKDYNNYLYYLNSFYFNIYKNLINHTNDSLFYNLKDLPTTFTNSHYNNICGSETRILTSIEYKANNFIVNNDVIISMYNTIRNIYNDRANSTDIQNMFHYIFNNNNLTFRYNRDLHGDIDMIPGTKYIVLDTDLSNNHEYDIDSINSNINLVYYLKDRDGNISRRTRTVPIDTFDNKNYSLVDHDEDIVIPSKTMFELLFNTNDITSNILNLKNMPGHEINNSYYNLKIDFSEMFSSDSSVVLRFAQKIIYNFDIVYIKDDDGHTIDHIYNETFCIDPAEVRPVRPVRPVPRYTCGDINGDNTYEEYDCSDNIGTIVDNPRTVECDGSNNVNSIGCGLGDCCIHSGASVSGGLLEQLGSHGQCTSQDITCHNDGIIRGFISSGCRCECPPGYIGANCEFDIHCTNEHDCNNNADSVSGDRVGGSGSCNCECRDGWADGPTQNDKCNVCADNFIGEDCNECVEGYGSRQGGPRCNINCNNLREAYERNVRLDRISQQQMDSILADVGCK